MIRRRHRGQPALVLLGLAALLSAAPPAGAASRLTIPAGRFAPLFGLPEGWPDLPVKTFGLDATPVTVFDFQRFLAKDPSWNRETRRGTPFADDGYLDALAQEGAGSQPGSDRLPITRVSWYAARAYCEAAGGRLPTTLEWEYAAAATPTRPDGTEDPAQTEAILRWYSRPTGSDQLRQVGLGAANFYGAKDLHELIWEWTDDFNGAFLATDSRSQGDRVKDLICGAGGVGAARSTDYATFMRYAYRGSLQPAFTQPNLGFRCAYDQD